MVTNVTLENISVIQAHMPYVEFRRPDVFRFGRRPFAVGIDSHPPISTLECVASLRPYVSENDRRTVRVNVGSSFAPDRHQSRLVLFLLVRRRRTLVRVLAENYHCDRPEGVASCLSDNLKAVRQLGDREEADPHLPDEPTP